MTSDEQKPTKAQRPLEWMRFDPVNFGLLCDGLTFAQVGALTKVMLHLWQKGPMQEADIRRIAKAEFDGIMNLLSPYNGGLSLELVEIAREHGQRRVSQTVKAGIASARKRNALSTNVEQEVNDRSTGVLSISISESYSKPKSKRKERTRETDPRFNELWKVYEGKGAMGKAREYWEKLSEEDKAAIIAKAPAYVLATSGDDLKYRKNLEGWINPQERRWEAPIIQRTTQPPKPKVWTKEEAIIEVRRLRELHGADFQTHHVPKDVLTAYRQMS